LFALNLAFNFHYMKNFTIFFSFIICINLNAQKNNYLSGWLDEKKDTVNISSKRFTYSKKGNFYYFLVNNNSDLILHIKTEDQSVKNRILKEGMTLWICMDRKLTRNMGVRFPIGSQYSGSNKPDATSDQLSVANTIELKGFTGEISKRFPSENADSFNGYVRLDNDGNLYYEMTMPLSKLPLRNSRDGKGAMPFNLGVEYGSSQSEAPEKSSFTSVLVWITNITLATFM
jgi:hypothetical protein